MTSHCTVAEQHPLLQFGLHHAVDMFKGKTLMPFCDKHYPKSL